MSRFPGVLSRHLHDHLGLVTDRELRMLGVSVDQRRRLVADDVLERVVGDVYRTTAVPRSMRQTALAVSLADDRSVVTGLAAGALWNARGMGAIDVVDVHLPHGANALTGDGIRVRRCPPLPPSDVTLRTDGIRVVSPPRLAFDLAAHLADDDLESVIEQILDREWCTVPTLIETGRRLFASRRPGALRFARVM